MSCRLKDYHKEGVSLDKSMKIISGLLDKEENIVKKVLRDFSSLNLIARNLESLGFLKYTHPPAAPKVTLKGGTLVLPRRPYLSSKLRQTSVPTKIGRFILLKAIRDSDWKCFKEFYLARFVEISPNLKTEKEKRESIRRRYYPQFSDINFYHWYRLHLSFIDETGARKVLGDGSDFQKDRFTTLDPYSLAFSPSQFFDEHLKRPSIGKLDQIVRKALSLYIENFLESSFIGHCETLKSIIQILLLDIDLFEDELRLSDAVITLLRKRGISFLRSNQPILTEGRGLIDRSRTTPASFKLFSIAQATFDDVFGGTPD